MVIFTWVVPEAVLDTGGYSERERCSNGPEMSSPFELSFDKLWFAGDLTKIVSWECNL